jgi:glycosyltransferase involved in cell wall biosynthesis
MNKSIVGGLLDMGANIKLYTNITEIDMNIDKAISLAKRGHRTVGIDSPFVHNSTFSRERNNYCAHYTMSEYDDVPNEYHKKLLNLSNEIWVPSEWDKQKFTAGGIDKPIKVMPLGVDSKIFSPKKGEVVFSSGLNDFKFISVCAHNWRKGHDVTLRAYKKAFGPDENVSLLFITHGFDLIEDVEIGIKDKLGQFMGEDSPHVAFCFSKIPEDAMAYVYGACDAFVLLSRGEGWGLPYIEASACGLPVVGVNHGGQACFLREEDSFLIKPDRKSQAPEKEQEFVGMYKGVEFADFSDRAIDEAAEKMRYVYDNYEKAKQKAEIARQRIVKDFTWEKSCQLVYNRLVELQP